MWRKARRIHQLEHSLVRLTLGVQDFAECFEEVLGRWEVSAQSRLNEKELRRWQMLRRETTALGKLCDSILHEPTLGLRR